MIIQNIYEGYIAGKRITIPQARWPHEVGLKKVSELNSYHSFAAYSSIAVDNSLNS